MKARLVLPPGADVDRREEWKAARRPGVTASEIAAILGLSPWGSATSVYYRKLGEVGDEADNDAMSLGRFLEAWIADRYMFGHPEFHVGLGGLYRSVERPWQLATPDRLLYDETADAECYSDLEPVSPLELKTSATYDEWGDDGTDVVPVQYRAQVLWQIDVLGVDEGRIACLFLHSRRIREYVIGRDETDLAAMRREAVAFLGRLERRDPPPVDWRPVTTDTLRALHPDLDDVEAQIGTQLASRYRAACRAEKEAKKRKQKYENQIRATLGRGRYAVHDGEKVARREVYERKAFTVRAGKVNRLVHVPKKGDKNDG